MKERILEMKRFVIIVIAVILLLAGCSDPQKPWEDFEFRGSHFGDSPGKVLEREENSLYDESWYHDGNYYIASFYSAEMYGYVVSLFYDFEYDKLIKVSLMFKDINLDRALDETRKELLGKLEAFGKPDISRLLEVGYSAYWVEDGYEINLYIVQAGAGMSISLDKELRGE